MRVTGWICLFVVSAGYAQNSENLEGILAREKARSNSDYTVYVPRSLDGSTFDTGNEHFLVFDGPDGSLMAVWTQSSYEGASDHRIVFSRSVNDGRTWTLPSIVAGPDRIGRGYSASWGFPLVSKRGRIYVLWSQYQGLHDIQPHYAGTMDSVYSDDFGKTWSKPQTVRMKRSPYDNPNSQYPSNWIVWQKPYRDLQGRWFTGFTRWVSSRVRTPQHRDSWTTRESVVEFLRFENIDDHPEPKNIKISWFAFGDEALRIPHYENPMLSIAQEPSIVRLPDKRLFCIMRSMTGYIWYSMSSDDGETWTTARPLLRKDKGLPVLSPLNCTPLYEYSPGRYILIHTNNNGRFEGSTPEETTKNRRPASIALGEFRPGAEQPVWFSESRVLMDNQGAKIGPLKRIDIGVYPSVTRRKGEFVLWHPERKFFLLGKRIPESFLNAMSVPQFTNPRK